MRGKKTWHCGRTASPVYKYLQGYINRINTLPIRVAPHRLRYTPAGHRPRYLTATELDRCHCRYHRCRTDLQLSSVQPVGRGYKVRWVMRKTIHSKSEEDNITNRNGQFLCVKTYYPIRQMKQTHLTPNVSPGLLKWIHQLINVSVTPTNVIAWDLK